MSCDIGFSTRKHRIDNDERESRNELVCLINNEPTPSFHFAFGTFGVH